MLSSTITIMHNDLLMDFTEDWHWFSLLLKYTEKKNGTLGLWSCIGLLRSAATRWIRHYSRKYSR